MRTVLLLQPYVLQHVGVPGGVPASEQVTSDLQPDVHCAGVYQLAGCTGRGVYLVSGVYLLEGCTMVSHLGRGAGPWGLYCEVQCIMVYLVLWRVYLPVDSTWHCMKTLPGPGVFLVWRTCKCSWGVYLCVNLFTSLVENTLISMPGTLSVNRMTHRCKTLSN